MIDMEEKRIESEKRPRTALIFLVSSCCLYALSIAWVIIGFANVSISTGELKPRGLYVDESAIQLVDWHQHQQRSPWHDIDKDKRSLMRALSNSNDSQVNDMITLCQIYSYCSVYDLLDHSKLHEIVIYPKGKALSAEAVVLVLPYSSMNQNVAIDIFLQMIDVYSNHSPWLTKKIVILCYLVTNMDDHKQFAEWMDQYHSLDGSKIVKNRGLIREGYILDLSLNISGWNKILVKHIGSDGHLPNMDLISLLTLSKESHLLKICPHSDLFFHHLHKAFDIIGLKHSSYRRYMRPLASLASTWQDMLLPEHEPNSLHSYFLKRNIDALTLQPTQSRKSANLIALSEDDEITIADMLVIVDKLIRISSALQEKLHHSHPSYLLMLPNLFVGFSEYMPTLGLMLLPLLIAYFIILSGNEPSFVVCYNSSLIRHGFAAAGLMHITLGTNQCDQTTAVLPVLFYLFCCVLMERDVRTTKDLRKYVGTFLLIAGVELSYIGMINYVIAFSISMVVIPCYIMISLVYLRILDQKSKSKSVVYALVLILSGLFMLLIRIIRVNASRLLLLSATLQFTILLDLVYSLGHHLL